MKTMLLSCDIAHPHVICLWLYHIASHKEFTTFQKLALWSRSCQDKL